MRDKQFEELKVSGKLPSPPGVGLEILRLTQTDDYSVGDIVNAIQRDPALTGRILQLANSAALAAIKPVTTVRDATVRMGVRTVRNVALGVSLVSGSRVGVCAAFDYNLFWAESLARAVVARVLAEELEVGSASDAFVCGLLSQIGRLALATIQPEAYADLLKNKYPGQNRILLCELEQKRFNINHEEIGAAMLLDWHLPEEFADAVQDVWLPPAEDVKPGLPLLMSAVVRIAAAFVSGRSFPVEPECVQLTLMRFPKWDPDKMAGIWDCAVQDWARWGKLMDVRTQAVPGFDASIAQETPDTENGTDASLLRFLIVHPKDTMRQQLVEQLKAAGHRVLTAATEEEAQCLILEDAPHIVIATRQAANLDGLRLCRSLRKADFAQGLYYILVSDSNDACDEIQAFEAGVDDYVHRSDEAGILVAHTRAGERFIRLQQRLQRDHRVVRSQAADLAVLSRELQKASVTDALTELPNRRYAMKLLQSEWRRGVQSGQPLVILMLDIDHFKKFNDRYGHDVGDVVLRQTAKTLSNCLRGSDTLCRIGGEEFVAVLMKTDMHHALQVAERLRSAVETKQITSGEFKGHATISIGVADWQAWMRDPEDQLKHADQALYEAKAAGRNRVVRATAGQPAEVVS